MFFAATAISASTKNRQQSSIKADIYNKKKIFESILCQRIPIHWSDLFKGDYFKSIVSAFGALTLMGLILAGN